MKLRRHSGGGSARPAAVQPPPPPPSLRLHAPSLSLPLFPRSGLATYGGPPPSAREAYGSQPGSARDGPTAEPFTPAGAPLQATALVEGSMRSPDEAKAEVRVWTAWLINVS